MKIDRIEIESFGKFKDYKMDFADGLNVIYGENEAGKSTVCIFIKAMFYDLSNSKQSMTLREDLRRRYLPWDSGDMSGKIYFSHGGKEYILERKLGKTSRGSKVKLCYAENWEEVKDIEKENIGKAFFGVGEDGFNKTLFINQLGAKIERGKDDEIIARLSNLSRTGDEDISYQKTVNELLKKKYALISKSNSTGEIIKLGEKNNLLLKELEETENREELYKQAVLKKEAAEKEKEIIVDKIKELENKKQRLIKYNKYKESKKAEERLRALKEQLEKDEKDIKRSDDDIEKLNEKKRSLEYLDGFCESDFKILSAAEKENEVLCEKLRTLLKKKEEYKKLEEEKISLDAKKNKKKIPFIVLGVIVAVMSVLCAVIFSPFCIAGLAVTSALFALSFKDADKKRKNELSVLLANFDYDTEKENELLSKQKENRDKTEKILKETHSFSSEDLLKKLTERKNIEELIKSAETENVLLKSHKSDVLEEAENLKSVILQNYDDEDFADVEYLTEEEILTEQKKCQSELIICEKTISESETIAERNGAERARSADVIKSEILANEKTKEELKLNYDALTKAIELMEESYEELKNDFAPKLSEKVRDVLVQLTDGKYTDVRVSDDFSLKVMTKNSIVYADYLSGGTYDIIYLALRLGILKVFYDKIPTLIFDDTFLQLDEKRARLAADYIKADNINQVLYFTCHKSQTEILCGKNVNFINMTSEGENV